MWRDLTYCGSCSNMTEAFMTSRLCTGPMLIPAYYTPQQQCSWYDTIIPQVTQAMHHKKGISTQPTLSSVARQFTCLCLSKAMMAQHCKSTKDGNDNNSSCSHVIDFYYYYYYYVSLSIFRTTKMTIIERVRQEVCINFHTSFVTYFYCTVLFIKTHPLDKYFLWLIDHGNGQIELVSFWNRKHEYTKTTH